MADQQHRPGILGQPLLQLGAQVHGAGLPQLAVPHRDQPMARTAQRGRKDAPSGTHSPRREEGRKIRHRPRNHGAWTQRRLPPLSLPPPRRQVPAAEASEP